MKNILSLAVLSVSLSAGLSAQNPTRKVLYTFTQNEVLKHGEQFIRCHADGYKFALLTTDTLTEKSAFVFNGKRIPLQSGDRNFPFLGYVDVNVPDGYMLMDMDEKGNYYVNRGGKTEGPYEYAWWDDGYDEYTAPWDREHTPKAKGYHYVLADRVYECVDGKITRSNLSRNIDGGKFVINGKVKRHDKPAYLHEVKGNTYLWSEYDGEASKMFVNDKFIDYRKNIYELKINSRGDYAYFSRISSEFGSEYVVMKNGRRIDDKTYARADALRLTESGEVAFKYDSGKLYLPETEDLTDYGDIDRNYFTYHENGDYAFRYRKDGQWFVKIKGMPDMGPYEQVFISYYLDNGRYAFSYEKDGQWFVKIKEVPDMGPYAYCGNIEMRESGAYLFAYKPVGANTEYDYTHIKTHKADYGPYDWIANNLRLSENGDCTFNFGKDGTAYHYENGVTTPDYETYMDGEEIALDIAGHSFYSKFDFAYVVIDGRRMGNAAAIECRYDEQRRAFVWHAVEGPALVAYVYALD